MLESQKKEQQQLLLQIKRIVASPAISVKNAKIAKELYKEIKNATELTNAMRIRVHNISNGKFD